MKYLAIAFSACFCFALAGCDDEPTQHEPTELEQSDQVEEELEPDLSELGDQELEEADQADSDTEDLVPDEDAEDLEQVEQSDGDVEDDELEELSDLEDLVEADQEDTAELEDLQDLEDVCVPDCEQRECGDDGCGGSCGDCLEGFGCSDEGLCQCIPQCADRCCGDDGCGGTCADACASGWACNVSSCDCEQVCGGLIELSECSSIAPAPTDSAEITSWIQGFNEPMHCRIDGADVYNFDVIIDDYGDDQLFMFGEVHGSKQLGHMSAALFEELVRRGLVNSLTMEVGMDMGEAMLEYVQTGAGKLISVYDYESLFGPDMFARTLMQSARELYLQGYVFDVFGSDVPMSLAWTYDELMKLINLMSPENQTIAKSGMPPSRAMGTFLSAQQVSAYASYSTHIQSSLPGLCTELSAEQCERLAILAEANWCSAFQNSEYAWFGSELQWAEFFRRREAVIYYNYRLHMPDASTRAYTHMGAAHTSKNDTILGGEPSVGYRLENLYPITQNAVYNTTPGNGPNSRIVYGWQTISLPVDPVAVSNALAAESPLAFYVSTHRPDESCVGNPLIGLPNVSDPTLVSDDYDAWVFYKRLTEEARSKAEPAETTRRLIEARERVWAQEAELN
ncbi:MAG: hypothetical protein RBU37_10560 [Myxococcota bacterium]|jgi:hypothetical protein|nr:hypothetical protein [Myxococcota bacterium]